MESEPPFSKKVTYWCGTEPSGELNEANQTPVEETMAFTAEEKERDPCVTQDTTMSTFGQDPDVKQGTDHGSGIMVGDHEIIPRWTANKSIPTKLPWYVIEAGWPGTDDRQYVIDQMTKATKQWNDLKLGIEFVTAPDKTQALFLVKYYKPKPGDRDKKVLASAFFPNKVTQLRVYDWSLTSKFWRTYLMNTLLHELGHIIGLRHEFALDPDPEHPGQVKEGDGAQRLGQKNDHSVMSYDDINYINDLDIKDTKAFYDLENKKVLNGAPITDFTPKALGAGAA